jgi:CRISPR-associated protein Cas2
MYAIVVYDMEAKRTRLLRKLCRRYLTHVQNSVFEGEISEGDLQALRGEIRDTLQSGESAIVYELSSDRLLSRTVVGQDPTEDSRFL